MAWTQSKFMLVSRRYAVDLSFLCSDFGMRIVTTVWSMSSGFISGCLFLGGIVGSFLFLQRTHDTAVSENGTGLLSWHIPGRYADREYVKLHASLCRRSQASRVGRTQAIAGRLLSSCRATE